MQRSQRERLAELDFLAEKGGRVPHGCIRIPGAIICTRHRVPSQGSGVGGHGPALAPDRHTDIRAGEFSRRKDVCLAPAFGVSGYVLWYQNAAPGMDGEPNVGSWRTGHFEISGQQPLPPPAARWVPKNVLAHNRKRAIGETASRPGAQTNEPSEGFAKGAAVPLARGSSAFKCKPLVGAERRTPSHGV